MRGCAAIWTQRPLSAMQSKGEREKQLLCLRRKNLRCCSSKLKLQDPLAGKGFPITLRRGKLPSPRRLQSQIRKIFARTWRIECGCRDFSRSVNCDSHANSDFSLDSISRAARYIGQDALGNRARCKHRVPGISRFFGSSRRGNGRSTSGPRWCCFSACRLPPALFMRNKLVSSPDCKQDQNRQDRTRSTPFGILLFGSWPGGWPS
jgi:hypothetical protein